MLIFKKIKFKSNIGLDRMVSPRPNRMILNSTFSIFKNIPIRFKTKQAPSKTISIRLVLSDFFIVIMYDFENLNKLKSKMNKDEGSTTQ